MRRRSNKPRTIKSGHCLSCNRPLRDPVSRERGYGPVCWKDVVVSTAGPASVPAGLFPATPHPKDIKRIVDDLPSDTHIDTIYFYKGLGECASHCQLRIWFAGNPYGALAIVTELDSNPGSSVTNVAETLWASIASEFDLGESFEMYEHYAWKGEPAHFNRVTFRLTVGGVFRGPKWTGMYSTSVMTDLIREFQAGKAVAA